MGQTSSGVVCLLTPPQMLFGEFYVQRPPPKLSLLRVPLCLLLAGSLDRESHSASRKKEAKHGCGEECERTAAFICTFTSRLVSLPVGHPDL